MILRIKALIYRYTGIYLAYREEANLLASRAHRREFDRMYREYLISKDNMHPLDIQGILIGSWQAKHGFTRVWANSKFARSCKAANWVSVVVLTLSLDLNRLFNRARLRKRRHRRPRGRGFLQ